MNIVISDAISEAFQGDTLIKTSLIKSNVKKKIIIIRSVFSVTSLHL